MSYPMIYIKNIFEYQAAACDLASTSCNELVSGITSSCQEKDFSC